MSTIALRQSAPSPRPRAEAALPAVAPAWDPLILSVALYILTAVGRIHQLFGALEPLHLAALAGVLAIGLYVIEPRAHAARRNGARRDADAAGGPAVLDDARRFRSRWSPATASIWSSTTSSRPRSCRSSSPARVRDTARTSSAWRSCISRARSSTRRRDHHRVQSRRRRQLAARPPLLLRRQRLRDVRRHGDPASAIYFLARRRRSS